MIKDSALDTPQPVLTDTSGNHAVCAIKSCPTEPQCGKRLCDSVDKDKCPFPKNDPSLVAKRVGTLTHKIPKGMEGVVLSSTDANGKPATQYLSNKDLKYMKYPVIIFNFFLTLLLQ